MTDCAFDAVSQFVEALVPSNLCDARRSRWDHGDDAALIQIGANGIGVVGLVGDQCVGFVVGKVDQGFV